MSTARRRRPGRAEVTGSLPQGKTVVSKTPIASVRTDLLVVPVFEGQLDILEIRALDSALGGLLLQEAARAGFEGNANESFSFQAHGSLPAGGVLLLGCGSRTSPSTWYALADAAYQAAFHARCSSVTVAPGRNAKPEQLAAVAEGFALSGYRFTKHKSQRDRRSSPSLAFCAGRANASLNSALSRSEITSAAACYARDLVNAPASDLTPLALAREAQRLARRGLQVKVHNQQALQRLGMGALLSVARGSAQPPCFIEIAYQPSVPARARIALVGKGVTFDSGGLCLKNPDSMRLQKRDMAGGATVLAVMSALPALGPCVEVRGYIPAAENMPGGKALKPGDVVRAVNGTTIEVLNTDAEGRLLLADGIAYAARRKPDAMIDFATLTAAVSNALGNRYAAIMGTDQRLISEFIAAGVAVDERLWELPLVPEYRRDLDSQVADIKNTGEGQAGTIIGGLFLREFAADLPWAHIDFSSTAISSGFPCHPQGATGFGVRCTLRYLSQV